MDELKSGSFSDSADISKTFDSDETFDKVLHKCKSSGVEGNGNGEMLSVGSQCLICGMRIRK